ncbi:hypothetical protein CEXT_791691 [Caerostris extrusa]|uniref:Uncharacterized protein n=1 Tax=Caerostris extrusa TaxID=172846 RepID=A0AAV4X7C1_CAEEX|nr:hypothetical protein CEXT_791691 [Caerostris extrusa]
MCQYKEFGRSQGFFHAYHKEIIEKDTRFAALKRAIRKWLTFQSEQSEFWKLMSIVHLRILASYCNIKKHLYCSMMTMPGGNMCRFCSTGTSVSTMQA